MTTLGKFEVNNNQVDRIKLLYPLVNETEHPLPRSWSPKDKSNYIGLSQNNLKVHYKGHGKTPIDAGSVRATHPIPSACGLYYFEVKIISKGRDGYMGIGLSAQGVNMNRLPGWDKQSYGYHGDDGHSFCSSGTGQVYGPTFTTGDVIGCGVNLIDNSCFYTKNGHNLGVAFVDLAPNLYPTVGLQTPGEVVDANFGQAPFVFDIEDMMKELRMQVQLTIQRFPVSDNKGEWQNILQRIVEAYLVHHGYCSTAEAFARSTQQEFTEELASIKHRQRIQRLVLAGRMGEAIEATQQLYPGLLEHNQQLLFVLRCRQFIEMVSGADSEVRSARSPKSQGSSPSMSPNYSNQRRSSLSRSRSSSPGTHPIQTSVIQSTKTFQPLPEQIMVINESESSVLTNCDIDMEDVNINGETSANGQINANGCKNGEIHGDEDLDGENTIRKKQALFAAPIIQFGRELKAFSVKLCREMGHNEENKRMLQDAFSLLAYIDPWNSPVGWQLDPVQRERICSLLNSAIQESHNLPRRPQLELAIAHTKELICQMSRINGLGACAFADLDSLLQH